MKRNRAIAAVIALLMCTAPTFAQIPVLTPGTTTRLEDLKGKIVMIRSFSGGPVLRYDSTGTLLEGGSPESWTLAGVKLAEISRRGDVLEMRGSRMALLFELGRVEPVERKVPHGRNKFNPDNVTIFVNLPRADDAAAVELAQRIFVTNAKQLNELVPEYWRTVVARLTGWTPENAEQASAGSVLAAGQQAQATGTAHQMSEVGAPVPSNPPVPVLRVGGGVSAPHVISNLDPVYVEAARIARIQGTTVLWVIVGRDGSVRDVRIARAIGFGLDDNAVAAVKQWQFKPSIKDGQPVAVQVSIEVNFRLY